MLYFQVTTTSPDDLTLLSPLCQGDQVSGHQYQWLAGGYDLE